jgi:hypothetical protein
MTVAVLLVLLFVLGMVISNGLAFIMVDSF